MIKTGQPSLPISIPKQNFNHIEIPKSLNKPSYADQLILGKNDNKFNIVCDNDMTNLTSEKPIKMNGLDIVNNFKKYDNLLTENETLNKKIDTLTQENKTINENILKLSELVLKLSSVVHTSFNLN